MTDRPEFDFARLSWKDSKALSAAQLRIRQAQAANDVAALEDGFAAIERFLARVVVSVPRGWLVEGAEAPASWAVPGAFDVLRSDAMQKLLMATNEAQQPGAVSGN